MAAVISKKLCPSSTNLMWGWREDSENVIKAVEEQTFFPQLTYILHKWINWENNRKGKNIVVSDQVALKF